MKILFLHVCVIVPALERELQITDNEVSVEVGALEMNRYNASSYKYQILGNEVIGSGETVCRYKIVFRQLWVGGRKPSLLTTLEILEGRMETVVRKVD